MKRRTLPLSPPAGVRPTAGWHPDAGLVRLARRSDRCTVLGPGVRAVLWVQGCPFRCPGCVAPETLPFSGGFEQSVITLGDELATLAGIDGVTFSGGEPMAQTAALVALVDAVRQRRDCSFLCYTGYTLEFLRARGSAAQRALLDRLDILIDGPYVQARHTDLVWRGSDNQRVHFLSARHESLRTHVNERGSRLEFEVLPDGGFGWMGIPPDGFREEFERAMAGQGVELIVTPHQ